MKITRLEITTDHPDDDFFCEYAVGGDLIIGVRTLNGLNLLSRDPVRTEGTLRLTPENVSALLRFLGIGDGEHVTEQE